MANVLLRAPTDRLPFDIRLERHHYRVTTGAPFGADPADVANLLIHGCSLVPPEETQAPQADVLTTLADAPTVPASEVIPEEPITYYGEATGGDAP